MIIKQLIDQTMQLFRVSDAWYNSANTSSIFDTLNNRVSHNDKIRPIVRDYNTLLTPHKCNDRDLAIVLELAKLSKTKEK